MSEETPVYWSAAYGAHILFSSLHLEGDTMSVDYWVVLTSYMCRISVQLKER